MKGTLSKLTSRLQEQEKVHYALPLGEQDIALNELIGRTLSLRFDGDIYCIACGRKTKKSYSQGYCFPCTQRLAACDICIVRPEKCHYHMGTCREPDWAAQHCMQLHYVYLANASGLKVGLTRHTQVPTRWIDQGACQALPILRAANRYIAGLAEVAIKAHMSDRTDWRQMLRGDPQTIDLHGEFDRLLPKLASLKNDMLTKFGADALVVEEHARELSISYPVMNYPQKIKSIGFDKQPVISGLLEGIKGQYLIFDCGVLNIRKHTGYEVAFEVC